MTLHQQIRVDPNEIDEVEGCKRWDCWVDVKGKRVATLFLERLPLNTDQDILLQADYDCYTPHEPVMAVCDGQELHSHVAAMLVRSPVEVMSEGREPSLLVTAAPVVEPDWQGLGLDRLLLARLLAELQVLGDVLCAAQVSHHLGSRSEQRAEVDRQRELFMDLGFVDLPRKRDLPRNVVVLPDWSGLHEAKRYHEQRWGFLPAPYVLW